MVEQVSMHELDEFVKKHRANASKVLRVLARNSKLLEALETEVGKELLGGIVARQDELLEKVWKEAASPQEMGEFRAIKLILDSWSARIAAYNAALELVRGGKGR